VSDLLHLPKRPLVAIVGPTGSGKSDLALTIAEAFCGEIVNFDSIQVYRRLDIGSAKPSPEAQRRVPHHLLNILDVTEELTAGAFARRARKLLPEVSGRGHLPVLVGGTGFYLRALLDGLSPAPHRDETLRARLSAAAPAALHRFLQRRDPLSASRIHPNDSQKLIRAIELTILAGRPASETQALARQGLEGYSVIKVGLAPKRAALRSRLDQRCVHMFECGLLEETGALLAEGVPADTKSLQSLGYKQAVAYLSGGMSLQAAIEECQIKTRQYAKRQMTWFRAEKDVHWLPGFGGDETTKQCALEYVRSSLDSMPGPAS
jgi:tRNA dimethylallyltransferase